MDHSPPPNPAIRRPFSVLGVHFTCPADGSGSRGAGPALAMREVMRVTMLSLIDKDPILEAKATSEVAARRARLTRVVKLVVGVVAAIGVVALGRVTFASAAEAPSPVASSETRVAHALQVDAVKAHLPARGLARASAHPGAKAQLGHGGAHR